MCCLGICGWTTASRRQMAAHRIIRVLPTWVEMVLMFQSFHGGKMLSSVKQTFVEAERANFKRFILPIYGNFIKKCFSE